MPRIEPIKLLNCLSVLLLPNGGIKSTDEVHRLAELMTKYSRKLVSKCIYIQILKCTETALLDLFMGSGGWRLVHTWLTESIVAKNWPLVKELLELLLLCPVNIDRLKTNNCPKLVKELSKDEQHCAIKALALKLVEQWLKSVKGEELTPVQISDIPKIISDMKTEIKPDESNTQVIEISNNIVKLECNENVQNDLKTEAIEESSNNDTISSTVGETNDENKESETLPVLKITRLKNGKQIISQVDEEIKVAEDITTKTEMKDKHKSKNKDRIDEKGSSSSKSSNSKHSSKSKSHNDKHYSHRDSSSKHSSSTSKDKRKEKDRRTSSQSSKSKSSSSSSKKSSSSSSMKSKDDKSHKSSLDKDKNLDKDKVSDKYRNSDKDKNKSSEKERVIADKEKNSTDRDDKPQTPSIHKLGKIPKLSDVKKEKPSISIEVRKPDDPKPKTVKTFHSKFRKHGLEEEVRPPPSRASVLTKKPPPVIPPTVSIPKRPSPIHNESPPEKKPKTIEIDKPGAIKLIPPKPKPMVLQESDMFMDALNASATNKKEPKKRKRRTSGSKDGPPNEGSPPHTPTISENKSVPPRFYQDTLDEDESKEKTEKETETDNKDETKTAADNAEDNMEISEPHTLTVNGLKGVLCYHKRKGPKKSIKWKPDSELEEIQYFELDETERVNVTKTFTDMKHLERIHEREAFQKARNLTNDDIMEEKTSWRQLILVDGGEQVQVEYGKNSKERDIQAIRQKGTLQPLYFHKAMIPDSPTEPDLETHTFAEPTSIPLDDVTGNVSDFRNMPWPEPKGNAPPTTNNNINVPPLFSPNMSQFPNNFPPAQFPGVPGFQGPPMIPGDWQANGPPVMPNGMTGPMGPPVLPPGSIPPGAIPPGAIPPGTMPPGLLGPPDTMMIGSKLFGGPSPLFPGAPDGFNIPQNMFPGDFNMSGPQVPPGPDGFGGPGNFRGAMRGRGAGGHWRGKANGNFDGPPRGRGGGRGGRKAVCIHFQRKGSCRQGDNCSFLHPGVNCPY